MTKFKLEGGRTIVIWSLVMDDGVHSYLLPQQRG